MRRQRASVAIATFLAFLCARGLAGQTFHPLGDLPGGAHLSVGVAVSNGPDPVVVGYSAVAGGQDQAFRWTIAEGMVPIASGFVGSRATDVSSDGSVIVGWLVDDSDPVTDINVAFRWEAEILTPLPNLAHDPKRPDFARAHGVSAAGDVIVGSSAKGNVGIGACAWLNGVPFAIGDLNPALPNSELLGVSADGAIGVGSSVGVAGQRDAVWDGGVQDFGAGIGIFAASGDGSVLGGPKGVWTEAEGWLDVGAPVRSIDDEGTFAVGGSLDALIASRCFDVLSLQEILEDAFGMDLGGWELNQALGISGDGRSIVGVGENPSGEAEGWLVILPETLPDFDQDGIPTAWECEGIDIDGDGVAEIDLPGMGADPLHQDLFIEVDVMAGLQFPQAARDLVTAAFDNAPIMNPDGTSGINLHIVVDETDLPFAAEWTTTNHWPDGFNPLKVLRYGTVAERNHAQAAALLNEKRNVFRYGIFANMLDTGSLGIAEVDGDDLIVLAGAPLLKDGVNDVEESAAVFMHEFGHNLGLRHGGGDAINGKPNYVSIMNYVMALRMAHNVNFWLLDYSLANLPLNGAAPTPLDEASLDEAGGIDSAGAYDDIWMPYGVNVVQEGRTVVRKARMLRLNGVAADFGRLLPGNDGFQDGVTTDSGIIQDLNFISADSPIHGMGQASAGQMLHGHNDWNAVDIAIPNPRTGQYIDAVQTDIPDDELTDAAVAWINANIAPPVACPGDLNADNTVNVMDLLVMLGAWGPAAGGDPADLNDDAVVNVLDLLIMLGTWGSC